MFAAAAAAALRLPGPGARLPCRDSVTRHGSIRGRRTVPIADVHSIAYISHACSIRAEDRDAALDGNLWLGNFTCNMNT